jgi:hypothetical protein
MRGETEMQYAMADARGKPQKVHIHWEHIQLSDDSVDRPDERDEGFWPSKDPRAAGYVNPEDYEAAHEAALERMRAWEDGEWEYVGNIARALIHVPIGGGSFRLFTIDSAGGAPKAMQMRHTLKRYSRTRRPN